MQESVIQGLELDDFFQDQQWSNMESQIIFPIHQMHQNSDFPQFCHPAPCTLEYNNQIKIWDKQFDM